MLALVVVQPLDLDIEESLRIHIDATIPLHDERKVHLVGVLHIHELFLKDRIGGKWFEAAQFVQIALPSPADL